MKASGCETPLAARCTNPPTHRCEVCRRALCNRHAVHDRMLNRHFCSYLCREKALLEKVTG